jgi:hypothetical protein
VPIPISKQNAPSVIGLGGYNTTLIGLAYLSLSASRRAIFTSTDFF